jgi:phage terminase large subunit-like protein
MSRKTSSVPAPDLLEGYVSGDAASLDAVEQRIQAQFQLAFLKMIPTQEQFIRIKNKRGRTPKTRLFEGANQCLTGASLIETPSGDVAVSELFQRGGSFKVYAWDGKHKVVSNALAPFSKGVSPQCYRVTLADGRWLETSGDHLLLSAISSYRKVSALASFFQPEFLRFYASILPPDEASLFLQESSSGIVLPVLPSGVLHLSQRQLDFLDRCFPDSGLCDERLHPVEGISQASSPSLTGARQHMGLPSSQTGDRGSKYANHVVSIRLIPSQEVFDFTVPEYHNYCAAGLISHNSGKSQIGVAEDIAHALGFRPWLERNDPDYRINIKVPNSGLVGCEVAGQSLIQNIEPRFMKYIPKWCNVEVTRYSDGAIKSLRLDYWENGLSRCGSTINFRSYIQPAESFEGVVNDWIHWDEPPPQAILNAAERGKMKSNAPSWMTMTPLKEPYIYDLFSLNAFNNGGDDQEIAVFRCSVWENCQDWCRDCGITIPENDPEAFDVDAIRPVNNCPGCGKVMGFMPRAGIENYLKKITDPDEREAREEGKWKHLSGLVYKILDRQQHLYPDFRIPDDWMRIECVDPSDARPTRWLFGAVSPEEIIVNGKTANRIYWYTYLLATGNIGSIARDVKVKRAEHNYREPEMVILDAKFGVRTTQSLDDSTSWEEQLGRAGIKHIVLSHSAPGDVGLGHKVVNEYLSPHYSALKDKSFPGMMFAAEGCKGAMGPTQCMFNYQWKIGTDKPEEAYKDFPDCVRYAALEQPVYRRPEPEIDSELARILLSRNNQSREENSLYYGLTVKT